MLRWITMALVVLAYEPWALAQPSSDPRTDPNVAPFYDDLAQDGQWVWLEPYGWVWYPNNVTGDWDPYSDGYWTYTDYGWYWNDNAAWGWAPFHYGAWTYTDRWVWVPGRVWAAAWVTWRWGEGRAGWAPLGPSGHVAEGPDRHNGWRFVDARQLLDRDLRQRTIPYERDHTYWERTRPLAAGPGRDSGRPPEGPARGELEHAVGRPIEVVRVDEARRRMDSGRQAHAPGPAPNEARAVPPSQPHPATPSPSAPSPQPKSHAQPHAPPAEPHTAPSPSSPPSPRSEPHTAPSPSSPPSPRSEPHAAPSSPRATPPKKAAPRSAAPNRAQTTRPQSKQSKPRSATPNPPAAPKRS